MGRLLIEWGTNPTPTPPAAQPIAAVEPDVEGSPEPVSLPAVRKIAVGDVVAEGKAWEAIEDAQRRYIEGVQNGDDKDTNEARRNWTGGALVTFATLTGQNPRELNQTLAEKYPIDTYQGMAVRKPQTIRRPDAPEGATKRVVPNADEIARLGAVVEVSPEDMAQMDTLVVDEAEHERVMGEIKADGRVFAEEPVDDD